MASQPITDRNSLALRLFFNERTARGLSALRFMLLGAACLVLVEKWRRGVFTGDELSALVILAVLVGFLGDLVRRRATKTGEAG
jgi:hypothetical protein